MPTNLSLAGERRAGLLGPSVAAGGANSGAERRQQQQQQRAEFSARLLPAEQPEGRCSPSGCSAASSCSSREPDVSIVDEQEELELESRFRLEPVGQLARRHRAATDEEEDEDDDDDDDDGEEDTEEEEEEEEVYPD